jgi:hypothetical protein
VVWEEVSGLAEVAEEQEVDRLFALGPESFVAARNEAARRLKKAGDAGAAARITALRRPSLSAWAVNQLARARGPQVEELLEAGRRLRAAHQEAVSGGGAAALRAATRAEREAVAGLVAAAVEVLESTGHAPTEATRERVAATLHAAAADPAAAELVRRGRLTHDLDPAGFGTADGLDAALEAWSAAEGAAPADAGSGATGARAAGARRARAGAAGAEPEGAGGGRRGAAATGKGREAGARGGDGTAAEAGAGTAAEARRADGKAAAEARARRLAAVAARDEARRRARLAADQAVLATRHAERLGRLADQAEREATRARKTASAAIDAAAAARERASRAAKELTEAEGRLAEDG